MVPAWVALAALLGLLGFVLIRNFQYDHQPLVQDKSDIIQKELAAVAETKSAFSELYYHRTIRAVTVRDVEKPPPDAPAVGAAGVRHRSANIDRSHPAGVAGARSAPGPNAHVAARKDLVGEKIADEAIRDWRAVAAAPAGRAAAWRRLGISLFLFRRPGGMEAFHRISRLPPQEPVAASMRGVPAKVRNRMTRLEASSLPVAEEMALWEALYGAAGPRPQEAPALRAKLTRLKLGWFEDIAAAQLYDRAGLHSDAERATRQARKSADSVLTLLIVEGALRIVGMLLWIAFFLVWGYRWIAKTMQWAPVTSKEIDRPPGNPEALVPPNFEMPGVRAGEAESGKKISYRTRMIAFVTYFGSFILIGFALQSLAPLVKSWSDLAALRLNGAMELAIYIPIVAVTLYVLKLSASAERHERISWRTTWRSVGLRADQLGRDALTAVVAYTMTVPAILFAAAISDRLFRHFHTPVHPVDLIILNTSDGWTRALLLLQAAVAAPIVEELTFRGLLFKGLSLRWGMGLAAVISSAIFALAHNTLPGGFLQLWTLGFAFAIVSRRNRSIVPNILMHAIHNGLVTMIMFAAFSK